MRILFRIRNKILFSGDGVWKHRRSYLQRLKCVWPAAESRAFNCLLLITFLFTLKSLPGPHSCSVQCAAVSRHIKNYLKLIQGQRCEGAEICWSLSSHSSLLWEFTHDSTADDTKVRVSMTVTGFAPAVAAVPPAEALLTVRGRFCAEWELTLWWLPGRSQWCADAAVDSCSDKQLFTVKRGDGSGRKSARSHWRLHLLRLAPVQTGVGLIPTFLHEGCVLSAKTCTLVWLKRLNYF